MEEDDEEESGDEEDEQTEVSPKLKNAVQRALGKGGFPEAVQEGGEETEADWVSVDGGKASLSTYIAGHRSSILLLLLLRGFLQYVQ